MRVVHTVNHAVRRTSSFSLKAKIKDIRQLVALFQQGHIAVAGLSKAAAADKHSAANSLPVLHNKSAHVTSILDAVKGNRALGVNW